ncbi:MAG: T9SS type A sorting domain-containing protein [Cyclobacteriaceae bacterium]
MKKILLFLIVFMFCTDISYSQACAISTDTAHLDVNNARIILQPSGDFFWNRNYEGFYVPKVDPSQTHTSIIFAAGLWLGGVDAGGNLKIAAQTYGASGGDADWWPGPIDINQNTTNATICDNFNKLWKVHREEIESHINDFETDGIINGLVPNSILAWPGRGNPESLAQNQFELPDQPLAPFVDRNGNSIYEPLLGDYPNVFGDEAIWWVFNDEGGGQPHGESLGNPVKAEVQVTAYGFKGENDEDLANTTFYDFKIYNRALEKLDSGYVSLWLDPQLGCDRDDYFGSLSTDKMAFIYNADAVDGWSGCDCDGIPTFCDNIPMTAFKILQGPLNINGEDVGFSSFTYYNDYSNIVGNPPPGVVDPATELEYYRYMTGSWKDGTPFSYGYDGYNFANSPPYFYAFDGNPSDTGQWSLLNETLPNYSRKMLVNSGPFHLQPGESTSISFAAMTTFDVETPNIEPLVSMGNTIQTFYDNLPTATSSVIKQKTTQFYPNPLVSEGKLTANGEVLESVRMFSLDGRIVQEYNHLNTSELSIERGGLPSGFYLYSALLRNGQLATGKIIVQ